MTLDAVRVTTPVGPLTVVVDASGAVLASGFCEPADLVALFDLPPVVVRRRIPVVSEALRAWLAGDTAALAAVPVGLEGPEFTRGVWSALQAVPPGRTVTYGELAADAGRPAAARAAGSACAHNRVAPFVPCHRAVPASGGLGRYAYGTDVKAWLLLHERH